MGIFSEALAEMDRNTVDYMIDEMQKKNDQLQQENAQLQGEIEQLKQKLYVRPSESIRRPFTINRIPIPKPLLNVQKRDCCMCYSLAFL